MPYVVVQTACSVNAFSDDMAVLLLHGAKRTLPSRWPDALVIDLEVIAEAPAGLNQAGVGELSAMFTAPADWRLADLMGLDGGYDEALVDLFRDDGEDWRSSLRGVALPATRLPSRWLCDRMTRSGLALGAVGRTAPLSGAEHAISHLLDMAAMRTGVPTGLHGAQVGVASVVVAAMWQDLLERLRRRARPGRAAHAGRGSGAHRAHLRRLRPVGRDGRRVLAAVPAEARRLDRRRRRAIRLRGATGRRTGRRSAGRAAVARADRARASGRLARRRPSRTSARARTRRAGRSPPRTCCATGSGSWTWST